MNNRPKRTDSEKDILEMQRAFLAEKAKNPNFQPAAGVVKTEKAPKKSIFARNREKMDLHSKTSEVSEVKKHADTVTPPDQYSATSVVLGDVVEKECVAPKETAVSNIEMPFPKVERSALRERVDGKSIFALSLEAKKKPSKSKEELNDDRKRQHNEIPMEVDSEPIVKSAKTQFGEQSFIVEDSNTANAVHSENLEILNKMKVEDILIEREKILQSLDPSLLEFIAKKRKEKMSAKLQTNITSNSKPDEDLPQLPEGNPAVELLKQSAAEQWIHFDVVEKDKLDWMRDIPQQVATLNAGEPYEARFDWKGVLLPYSEECSQSKDDRELYLHGDEPFRPGYTLQELFRLARSNVIQQRVSAFAAVGGILSIHNQGFYDSVLELPIAKIFFLLRFGLDENAPVVLEVVAKSLALLFYNETDETLLDYIYENTGCYWQPILAVKESEESEDPMSIENLQKQMKSLRMGSSIKANVQESEEESKASMTDFQLAETDLIECLLRSNIIQRTYFILTSIKPDNSTVTSCLKLLIRLARTSKDTSIQIVNYGDLMNALFVHFLPGLQSVDTSLSSTPFYNYPQHLVLKLCRVLISQSLSCALKLLSMNIVDRIQNYLFNQEDIKTNIIKVQIESLRVLRSLMLLRSDTALYRKFLPAFRYMLEWHHHHVVYEKGGSYLLRQHASALLGAITSGPNGYEVDSMLGSSLVDVCCNWFYRATQCGVQEFTQSTLLTSCLGAVSWFMRNNDIGKFREFIEKYLKRFLESSSFLEFEKPLQQTSILLRSQDVMDRRNIFPALPNVGAILMNNHGPQIVVPQAYCVYFLTALWRLTKQTVESGERLLSNCLVQVQAIEPIVELLKGLSSGINTYLATNFFAKCELRLVFQLLCFDGFREYLGKEVIFRAVYNFLCCLCAEHIPEIERLFEKVIFNAEFLPSESQETLNKWRNMFLEVVYPHYVVVAPTEICLSMVASPVPILTRDWPYSQLKIILENYVRNVHQRPAALVSEREVVRVTLTFTSLLENDAFQITSPTEKLMYLMITFMGPDSQFLDPAIKALLQEHISTFYKSCANLEFEFDKAFEGKCKFENLYALFVDHFQAASYGDALFSSMVLVPLAQKYDNKWRRMIWSEHVSALRYLNCDESLLIGGIDAYLNPPEEEESLIKCYARALHTNLVRPNTVVHKIAQTHLERYKEKYSKSEIVK